MKNFKTLKSILIIFTTTTIFVSCSDDNTPTPEPEANYSENLTNIANNVIVATYSDLANKAADLYTLAGNFKTTVNASNLDATKQAWRSTRSPWEQSEGFLFGPVDDSGLATDGAIDSWPVNIIDMNALLADVSGTPNITETIIDAQTNEAKGFHLIEYLLWGIDGNKQVADFTARELDYLVAACENLKNRTADLEEAWLVSGGNYVSLLINANSSEFPSEKSVLETLATALIIIADEVGNGKIEVPLNGDGGTGVDPTQEESRFSHNSKIDFANNVRSISNVYNGKYLTDDKGIADIVATINPTLDTQFQSEIAAAIQAIEAIPGTFSEAIISNRSAVENAQTKVRTVQETLESQIKPLISNL